jgi:hypothetical protein
VALSRNSTQIATDALTRIGVCSPADPPSAEDLATALDRLTLVQSDLIQRGVVYVANIEEVPNAVAHHLANMLGLFLMADFGASAGSVNLPPQDSTETALRRLTAVKPIFTTLRADYS